MAFKKIGAAWRNKKSGYTAKIDSMPPGGKFQIFKNEHKKEDKHPDLIIGYFGDEKKTEEPLLIPDDDIPFK